MTGLIIWLFGCFCLFFFLRRRQFLNIRPWWFYIGHSILDIGVIVNPLPFHEELGITWIWGIAIYLGIILGYILARYAYFRKLLNLGSSFIFIEFFIYLACIALADTIGSLFR